MSDKTTRAACDDMLFKSESERLISSQATEHFYNSISTKICDQEESWQIPLSEFLGKKQGRKIQFYKSKPVRSFYKAQDDLIAAYEDVSGMDKRDVTNLLTSGKLVASILSGSMSIISSLTDSVVDLLSGIIMWWAARAVSRRNVYTYPQGRTKLEPVAIVILAVVMSLASVELIRESITKVITLTQDPTGLPAMELSTFLITGTTVVVKLVLWLVCRRVDSSIVQALAMDHRNDVMSNTVAILCGYLGSEQFQQQFNLYGFIFVDPGGAILISLYIIVNWCLLAKEQIAHLTGKTADPYFLSKVTWLAMNHHRLIQHMDTVRAYHMGSRLLVELDIVLPADTPLQTVHDIGESLQQKVERLPEVERAYVHVDYETSHSPLSEHKVA